MVLIQLLLPVERPDASNTMTSFAQTREELAARFKGVTTYVRSPAKGLWTAADHVRALPIQMLDDNNQS